MELRPARKPRVGRNDAKRRSAAAPRTAGTGRAVSRQRSDASVGALLAASLVLVAALSIGIGRTSGGPSFGFGDPAIAQAVLVEIRLPRTLLGLLVGGTLGLCGAALQGLLRNPLAEPGLLGASSGAAFGAVLVFYFGLSAADTLLLPAGAVAGSLAALGALYGLAGRTGSVVTIVLAGIAINALAAALTSLALNFAPSPYAALEILFWMLGSLADRSLAHVWLTLPLMIPGWALVASAARGLDALTLGEETAQSLGFPPQRTQWLVIGGTALAVGAAVAVTGVVGFVGLVVPHLLRPWVGQHPRRLLAPSFVAGAVLTLAADVAIRLMPPGPELKLGVVTALLGAPFFLHLIMRPRIVAG
ncbi:MAG: iron ABC transporter permease [Gammaproteobacteria bacterium]|nr:iron ABC transporter permease [Gammaproteobacteria bacterium]